jgi:xylulokinase
VLCGLLDGLDALRAVGASVDGRLFLVGGGSRSAAYRQRCADLTGHDVIIPHTDETVATGAAVQAAVVSSGGSIATVTQRWQLGVGVIAAPTCDGSSVRVHYALARDRYASR